MARGRRYAGFFSSAGSFELPPGPHVEPGRVRGYYIDLRVKAHEAGWVPSAIRPDLYWVITCQWGLGSYERYLAGDGRRWLDIALAVARHLVERQVRGGPQDGGWVHDRPFPHTFPVRPPWVSAMTQGQGASLLVRIHGETGEEAFADAARRALAPMRVASGEGGAAAQLDGAWFPEEYPTIPPSLVLNGCIFALWGCYDVGTGLEDGAAARLFADGVDGLARNLHRWDTGYWSRYDLYPHPVANVASSAYHALHINQLAVLNLLVSRPELVEVRERWEAYARSPGSRARAFVAKSLFRLVVPRNRFLARRLPWTAPARA